MPWGDFHLIELLAIPKEGVVVVGVLLHVSANALDPNSCIVPKIMSVSVKQNERNVNILTTTLQCRLVHHS